MATHLSSWVLCWDSLQAVSGGLSVPQVQLINIFKWWVCFSLCQFISYIGEEPVVVKAVEEDLEELFLSLLFCFLVFVFPSWICSRLGTGLLYSTRGWILLIPFLSILIKSIFHPVSPTLQIYVRIPTRIWGQRS